MSNQYDNNGQYSKHSILRYEKIFGEGFVSTGGADVTHYFCNKLRIRPSSKILDIGSGLGGAAFYMAETFDAKVDGIDLSSQMIEIANEKARAQSKGRVSFSQGDIQEKGIPASSYDLIWSRDAILHIENKRALFQAMYDGLKTDGQIMLSDYAQSPNPQSPDFANYVKKSGYFLLDVNQCAELLKSVGFMDVMVEDWTERFVNTLKNEQNRILKQKDLFLEDFSKDDLDYLLQRWENKIQFCKQGDMKVGLWHARRLG